MSTYHSGCCAWSRASPVPAELLIQGSDRRVATGVVIIDQGAIRGSRRRNPPPTPACSPIRRGVRESRRREAGPVQLQLRGHCPACNGAGMIYTSLASWPRSPPPQDARASGSKLRCSSSRWAAKNISRSTRHAHDRSRESSSAAASRGTPAAQGVLARSPRRLGCVGLGQPFTALSGGRAARAQAGRQMAEKGRRLRPGRTDDRPALPVPVELARPARPTRGVRQVSDRHQTTSGHGARRLDHRPRPRRRPRRRQDRLRGNPGRPRRRPINPHGQAPRGIRRRLTVT